MRASPTKDAIFKTLDEVGVLSSLKTLQSKVIAKFDKEVSLANLSNYRKLYCKANEITNADCRKNEDQWRRDMLNDNRTTMYQVNRLRNFLAKSGISAKDFTDLVGNGNQKFHSLDQLVNSIKVVELLQEEAVA